ncbi:MAG: hypothetical protein WD533_04670 [Dehalococcoidia bacterium]
MTDVLPPERTDDGYDEREQEEIEELNRATSSSTFLEKKWWRWIGISAAVLLVATLIIPVLQPLFGGGDGQPNGQGGQGLEAPNFLLSSPNRGDITLSDQVAGNDYVILLFYRTYN